MKELDKGGRTEEVLRMYYQESGYFVLRSVQLKVDGADVSDVDVWGYAKASLVSRETIVVDAKQRGSPKAMERLLWTSGLKKFLNASRAAVATTDKRHAVTACGEMCGVDVISGEFLGSLVARLSVQQGRLTEEGFQAALESASRPQLNLRAVYQEMKSTFVLDAGFGALVACLEHFRVAAGLAGSESRYGGGLRLMYMAAALVSASADFAVCKLSHMDQQSRLKEFSDGVRYGKKGKEAFDELIRAAADLVVAVDRNATSIAAAIRRAPADALGGLATQSLAEYFCKSSVAEQLFGVAREFELAAFSSTLVGAANLSTAAQGVVGVLCDYFQIGRTQFLS